MKGRTARRNQTAWKELMLSNNVHLLLLCLIEILPACFLKPLQHIYTFSGIAPAGQVEAGISVQLRDMNCGLS